MHGGKAVLFQDLFGDTGAPSTVTVDHDRLVLIGTEKGEIFLDFGVRNVERPLEMTGFELFFATHIHNQSS
jgi:hypothetical protein